MKLASSQYSAENQRSLTSHAAGAAELKRVAVAATATAIAAQQLRMMAVQQSAVDETNLAGVAATTSTLNAASLASAAAQTAVIAALQLLATTDHDLVCRDLHQAALARYTSSREGRAQQCADELWLLGDSHKQATAAADAAHLVALDEAQSQHQQDMDKRAQTSSDAQAAMKAANEAEVIKQEADILALTRAAEAELANERENRRLGMERVVSHAAAIKASSDTVSAALAAQAATHATELKDSNTNHARVLGKNEAAFVSEMKKIALLQKAEHVRARKRQERGRVAVVNSNLQSARRLHDLHVKQNEVAADDYNAQLIVQQNVYAGQLRDERLNLSQLLTTGTEAALKDFTAKVVVLKSMLEDSLVEQGLQYTQHGQQIVQFINTGLAELQQQALPNHPHRVSLVVAQSVPASWMGGQQVRHSKGNTPSVLCVFCM